MNNLTRDQNATGQLNRPTANPSTFLIFATIHFLGQYGQKCEAVEISNIKKTHTALNQNSLTQ